MTEIVHQTETRTDRRPPPVRPFQMEFADAELAELRQRIASTRWPDGETVRDATQGVQLETLQRLALYWLADYDWRRCEAHLNCLPHFLTEIDGLDIHFIHVRSPHANALPVILTHGWPGSFIEFLEVIEPLTNPANPAEAFDVVIPSIPGYGFSGQPTTTGWDVAHIARAWTQLMKRLGYTQFVAQGGDWGALITDLMGVQAPPELLAIHTSMPGAVPADLDDAARAGFAPPGDLTDEERRAYERLVVAYQHFTYAAIMGSRPQALAALADSPIGLAAFMIDLPTDELVAPVIAGECAGLSRDDILDNITLYWLTNTAISAARLYWENKLPFFTPKGVEVPVAVSTFADDIDVCPRSWALRAYPKLVYYNQVAKGGHFAAWEQPQLFAEELRAGFRPLRVH